MLRGYITHIARVGDAKTAIIQPPDPTLIITTTLHMVSEAHTTIQSEQAISYITTTDVQRVK